MHHIIIITIVITIIIITIIIIIYYYYCYYYYCYYYYYYHKRTCWLRVSAILGRIWQHMHSCREKHNKPRSKAAAETLPQGSLPLPLEMMESRSQSATWFVTRSS